MLLSVSCRYPGVVPAAGALFEEAHGPSAEAPAGGVLPAAAPVRQAEFSGSRSGSGAEPPWKVSFSSSVPVPARRARRPRSAWPFPVACLGSAACAGSASQPSSLDRAKAPLSPPATDRDSVSTAVCDQTSAPDAADVGAAVAEGAEGVLADRAVEAGVADRDAFAAPAAEVAGGGVPMGTVAGARVRIPSLTGFPAPLAVSATARRAPAGPASANRTRCACGRRNVSWYGTWAVPCGRRSASPAISADTGIPRVSWDSGARR